MRIKNSIRNTSFAIASQLIGIILSFINRTIFISILGAEYLGVNGLFSNLLTVLSLAELGVGSAITYNLYKPLADKDQYKISALINLYARAYKLIGIVVAVLGILMIPFLDNIIQGAHELKNLELIYIIFLSNSVSTYFYAHKRSLIIADQKGYKDTLNRLMFNIIQCISQIIILIFTKNYILYLIIQFICNIVSNISMASKVNKEYTYLDKTAKLDKYETKEIFKHVYAMMSHKVGGVVVGGTDNLLISSMVGIYWVGLYSNYTLLIGIIHSIVGQVFSAITASIGNLNATEETSKKKEIFNIIFFFNAWIYGFCAIALINLLNPFIAVWIGEEYLLSKGIVLIIVLNFFLVGMRQTTISYNTTLGLFWNDRYKPWVEAIINLIVSIILLKRLGFIGVLVGTFISTVTTSFWVDPYILYKYGFKEKLRDYFYRYIGYIVIIMFTGIISYKICSLFTDFTWMNLFSRVGVCVVVPNIIFILCFYRTNELKYFLKLLKEIIAKVIKLKR